MTLGVYYLNIDIDVLLISFALLGFGFLVMTVRARVLTLLFVFMLAMQYGIIVMGLSHIIGHVIKSDDSPLMLVIVLLAAQLLTYPALIYVVQKKIRPILLNYTESRIWKLIWVLPVCFSALQFSVNYTEYDWHDVYFTVMHTIISLWVYHFIFQIFKEISENARLAENVRMTDQMLAMQGEQYMALTENLEKTRRARHDLRHHLTVMTGLLGAKDYDGLTDYLAKYQSSMPEIMETAYCHNAAVNAVISHYISKAKAAGAVVDIKFNLPGDFNIPESDLCIILGNLLENAAEDIERTGGGTLNVRTKITGDNLIITVDNSTGNVLRAENGEYLSTKHEGVGIGLKSIRAIAEKYDGEARFELSGGRFMASVRVQKRNE
jgi:signal transduction histidine kinase